MTKELAKTLTTALVQFIDRERQEGTMCCSSYECEKLEKAFEGGCYDVVESLIKKKLTGLTEFEQALSNYLKNDFEYFHTKKWDEQKWNEVIRKQSKELLALAKKELEGKNVMWLKDDDYDPSDNSWELGSVGLGHKGYYIPYSDLLKLPKEE